MLELQRTHKRIRKNKTHRTTRNKKETQHLRLIRGSHANHNLDNCNRLDSHHLRRNLDVYNWVSNILDNLCSSISIIHRRLNRLTKLLNPFSLKQITPVTLTVRLKVTATRTSLNRLIKQVSIPCSAMLKTSNFGTFLNWMVHSTKCADLALYGLLLNLHTTHKK